MLHPIVAQLEPSPEQTPAVTARGCDVVVTAGAGAGKTRTLVARYLSLLADGLHPRNIAAITFTRKAAREMRNRVREAISAYIRLPSLDSSERLQWEELYGQLDAARIGTIHSLCSEILRAHPAEAAIDPRFAMLDEVETTLFKRDAIENALGWVADERDHVHLFQTFGERDLRQMLQILLNSRLEVDDILAQLPARIVPQWQEVLRRRQMARLNRFLTSAEWCEQVAVLESNVALDVKDKLEIQRVSALEAIAESHAAEDWQLRREALARLDQINLVGGRQAAWAEGKEQRDEVKEALRILRQSWRAEADFQQLDINDADKLLASALPSIKATFNYAQRTYERLREQRSALDFDDLEARALTLLNENKVVCSRWQAEIQALLVDEYQDTNGRQRDLINLLNGSGAKLFIVGDAKQSIYRFRGADVTVFREERERIAQSGVAFTLNTSYRAHKQLIACLNAILEPVLGPVEAATHPWQEPFAALRHYREEPYASLQPPSVELHLSLGSKSDGGLDHAAHMLAGYILDLVEGEETSLQYGDIAILCRASTSFAAYEGALDSMGIPYLTVAGRGFYERPEIRDILNALHALSDPTDDLALLGLLRSPVVGFNDAEIYHLCREQKELQTPSLWQVAMSSEEPKCIHATSLIRRLHTLAGRVTVADLLKAFLDETAYRAALRSAEQHRALRNVSKLLELAHTSAMVAVDDFLEYVKAVSGGAGREGEARATAENAVQIMSVHKAKGLEFPVVVLGDATYSNSRSSRVLLDEELGVLAQPDRASDETPAVLKAAKAREGSQEEAEAKRLLYVAATRARDKLLVSGCVKLNKKNQLSGLRGWLRELAQPLRLKEQMLDCNLDGGESHTVELSLAAQTIACHVYEPGYKIDRTFNVPNTTTMMTIVPEDVWSPLLLKDLQPASKQNEGESIERLWRVVPDSQRTNLPTYLLGSLLHEALQAWRFPDGPKSNFEQWVKARARQQGVVSAGHLEHIVHHIGRLMTRFRRHPFYRVLEQAEKRLHEIPYVLETPDGFEEGRIDLLFLQDGCWTIVEFKANALNDDGQLQKLLVQPDGYLSQLRRYVSAVEQLLGTAPDACLCLLDYCGSVRLIDQNGHAFKDL